MSPINLWSPIFHASSNATNTSIWRWINWLAFCVTIIWTYEMKWTYFMRWWNGSCIRMRHAFNSFPIYCWPFVWHNWIRNFSPQMLRIWHAKSSVCHWFRRQSIWNVVNHFNDTSGQHYSIHIHDMQQSIEIISLAVAVPLTHRHHQDHHHHHYRHRRRWHHHRPSHSLIRIGQVDRKCLRFELCTIRRRNRLWLRSPVQMLFFKKPEIKERDFSCANILVVVLRICFCKYFA